MHIEDVRRTTPGRRGARRTRTRNIVAIGTIGLLAVLAGCGSSGDSGSTTSAATASATTGSTAGASSGVAAATATSAATFGGMEQLVAAATAEGKLNVIALPPDWANYGEIISAFQAKYPGIAIDSQQPDASSAQEITAAQTNKGTDKAPDVFDLGPSVALQNVAMFAPYQVVDFDRSRPRTRNRPAPG